MRNKWYLYTFIIALAILGISLEQNTVPNQEILIKFATSQNNVHNTQDAIALVKSKLENVDVSNIKVEKLIDGTLKLSYYSDLEVSEIQEIFSETNNSQAYTTTPDHYPTDDGADYYKLDIYKIRDTSDFDGPAGHIIEPKSETTRATSFDTYAAFNNQQVREENSNTHTTYTLYRYNAIALENIQYRIPQVRAGPIS
ncbi:hypothetical protein [uncultured Dokdonia sp.]|uniref:hypothetical protein n=1 Tax=uncultured Dokdonia sp. TaxID=575653 RepID=UPI0026227555|nr:hypothetical protein [uncultured Dokdonia sp.]